MRIKEIVSQELIAELKDSNVIGIDIGSRTAKAVLISNGELYTDQIGTGLYMQDAANELIENLLWEEKKFLML